MGCERGLARARASPGQREALRDSRGAVVTYREAGTGVPGCVPACGRIHVLCSCVCSYVCLCIFFALEIIPDQIE